MFYGLDFSDCKFLTDYQGNKLRADIPYPMFSSLVEFWKEARRAQTATLEKRTPPGSIRTSLSNVATSADESQSEVVVENNRQKPPPHLPRDKWDELMSRMPIETKGPPDSESAPPEPTLPIAATESPDLESIPQAPKTKPSKWKEPSFFPRQFEADIPPEINALIMSGTHFIRAWREYRGFTIEDSAELYGKQIATIVWHERGLNVPTAATLAKFADIYDCAIEQLTAKAGSSTQAHADAKPAQAKRHKHDKSVPRESVVPMAPDDTDYPDVVLAHLMAGKSPLTAWRLFRGLTRAQVAQEYGASVSNITQLEAASFLRPKTIEKLRVIVNCTAVQLLRPEGMKIEPHKLSMRDAWQASHAAA